LIGSILLSTGLTQDMPRNNLMETLNAVQSKVDQKKINIFEYPELLSNFPEYTTLEAQSKTEWRDALANLQIIAPSDVAKRILFESFQSLDANDYLEFLNRAASLCENGQISKGIFGDVLSPSGRMQAFLVDNYNYPAVRNLLERARRIFFDNAQEIKAIDSILSGDSKEMLDNYRKAHAGLKGESPEELKLNATSPAKTPIPKEPKEITEPPTMPVPHASPSSATKLLPGAHAAPTGDSPKSTPAETEATRNLFWLWIGGAIILLVIIGIMFKLRQR